MDGRGTPRLADEALAEEIEIYSHLVLAATESPCRLTLQQIDAALGLADPPSAHPGGRSADDERQGHGEAADQPDHRDDA